MEKKQLGDESQSKLFAQPTTGPMLVIKTNLDSSDVSEENPYFQNTQLKDQEEIREFFKE